MDLLNVLRPLGRWASVVLVATPALAQDGDPEKAPRRDRAGLAPKIHGAELRERAEAAIGRGFKFLITHQNEDGSFGSHNPDMASLKDFGFKTGNRGSQDAVRGACTAIVATALLRQPERNPAEENALQRAIDDLLRTEKFAYELGEAFCAWGYGYKLAFLVELHASLQGDDEAIVKQREAVEAAAAVCIKGLGRYQLVDGGWNYYSGPNLGGTSMSFTTANLMEALVHADRQGMAVPEGIIGDASKLLRRMRTARGGFVYDARFLNSAREVNVVSQGARTAACVEALVEAGDYGPDDVRDALRVFRESENWLEQGRKLIVPHSAVHQISGYFFFYGYHFTAELMARLGEEITTDQWERHAWAMIRTQEEDGCWWDTPAGDYGDKWGTGFAVLALQRYLEAVPADSKGDKR